MAVGRLVVVGQARDFATNHGQSSQGHCIHEKEQLDQLYFLDLVLGLHELLKSKACYQEHESET